MTIKEININIESEVDVEADARIVIGRFETNRLIDKGEYAAALLVAAVDLEYILEEHLKRYYRKNKGTIQEIDNDDFKDDLGDARKENSGSLAMCINIFNDLYGKYFDDMDYPDWTDEISKNKWKESKDSLEKLKRVRNEIAHDRGTFKEIKELKHEKFDSKEKVEDLIDSVYDFCKQHPV